MEAPQGKNVRVSVVVVSYNSATALRACLEALARSVDREKLEILVVDCGSVDESPRLDADFPGAQFLRLPRHFGYTKARNIGVRTAAGEFIFFLDAEVEVAPDTVSTLAARLEADPEAAAVCPLLVDSAGNPLPDLYDLPTPGTLSKAWREDSFGEARVLAAGTEPVAVEHASSAAFMIRAYYVKGINYLDQRFPHSWAGTDLCFQIWRASKKIVALPACRVTWRREMAAERALGPAARALLSADYALGAARFAAKYVGFLAGVRARVGVVFHALGRVLGGLARARDVGYHFSRFNFLLSGQRIDGTQRHL
jgi:GT2 family glycosyltransferase